MAAPSRTTPQNPSAPFSVRVGRTEVRIYPRAEERGRKAGFHVADYSTGKRRLRWFTEEKQARTEAARIAARMNAGDADGAALTGGDRRDLLRATELVAPFGLDVPTACALFAEAAALVGPHSIVAAAKAFSKRSPASQKPVPLLDALAAYFESKEGKGRSPRLLSDIRSRVGRFVREHPGKAIGDFSAADIQQWLDGLRTADGAPVSAQTRLNYGTLLSGLFEFHRRRGSIPENPVRDVERETVRRSGDDEHWTPKEAEALLAHASQGALPALVVGLFCGCRTAELCRLRWKDVDLAQRHVAVASDKAKTGSRRLTPIPDNALAWLAPLTGAPEEPLFNGHPTHLPQCVSEAAKAAGVRRIANGARHTWVTYRVALTGDVSRTALEAGNSPSVVHAHYRGLATREQAEAFFAIMPATRKGGSHAA